MIVRVSGKVLCLDPLHHEPFDLLTCCMLDHIFSPAHLAAFSATCSGAAVSGCLKINPPSMDAAFPPAPRICIDLLQGQSENVTSRQPICCRAPCCALATTLKALSQPHACMDPAKSKIAVVADVKSAKAGDNPTKILAAALSELLRQAKRQTSLLETMVQRREPLKNATTALQPPAKAAGAAPAAAVAAQPPKARNGARSSSSGGGSGGSFTAEELRSRARAHNHLLDTENPRSRAILALLRDDGTVPDNFPVRVASLQPGLSQNYRHCFAPQCSCSASLWGTAS